MKRCTFFICLVLIFFCANAEKIHYINRYITPQTALALIKALPEVKSFIQSKKNLMPILILERKPDLTNRYYCIALGISNYGQFRTSDKYFVDSVTGQIFIDDPMNVSNDDLYHLVTLQQLRRWGNIAGWAKPHIFLNGKLMVVKDKKPIHVDTK